MALSFISGALLSYAFSKLFKGNNDQEERKISQNNTKTELEPGIASLSQNKSTTSSYKSWCPRKLEKAGQITDLTLSCSIPMTLEQDVGSGRVQSICNIYISQQITDWIHKKLRETPVSGISGIYFADIVDLVLNRGAARIYVSGGYLRDIFVGKDADDVDILFAQEGAESVGIIPYLINVCEAKGWPVDRKIDERTNNPRWDFVCIGDKSENDGGQKFTGHPVGVGCEGDFACNTMLYNIMTGAFIDPTGYGWKDALDFVLRIPFPPDQWEGWLSSDRCEGMRPLRYVNFCSRGFVPANQELRVFIMNTIKRLFESDVVNSEKIQIKETTQVFIKRKVLRGQDHDKNLKRESAFRNTFIKEMSKSGVLGDLSERKAQDWYKNHVYLCYPQDFKVLD